jgi:hypothetical protein
MREIRTVEAKNKVSDLLDSVASIEEVGTPGPDNVGVRHVPAKSGFDGVKAERAMAGILDARRGTSLAGLSLKDLVNEGRP